jgi:hypothetical protein
MQADHHDDDDRRRRDRRVGERFVPEGDHDRAARHQFEVRRDADGAEDLRTFCACCPG